MVVLLDDEVENFHVLLVFVGLPPVDMFVKRINKKKQPKAPLGQYQAGSVYSMERIHTFRTINNCILSNSDLENANLKKVVQISETKSVIKA